MTYEENREFSADLHGIVRPLADHFIGVRLDYYQQRGAWQGDLWRQLGNGLDTAEQVIFDTERRILTHHRSYKNGKGLTPAELQEIADKVPGKPGQVDTLRLSWFLQERAPYANEVLDRGAADRYGTSDGAVLEARKVRRPLVRVDGEAAVLLESHQEFLKRHLRQFWWQRGPAEAPARLVVMNPHDLNDGGGPGALTLGCSKGKVPTVMAVIDLKRGVDLKTVSPALDECWRQYMTQRPSNADNLTFAKERIAEFKALDEQIRQLARAGRLLAPGGRRLFREGKG